MKSYKYLLIIILIAILLLIILILFSLCCLFLYKFFHIKLNNIYLENYHGNSENILSKYGDYPIKKVYIVKEKLNNIIIIPILDKMYEIFLKRKYDFGDLIHTSLIFEIDLGNNIKKIKINKNAYLNITENFNMNGSIQELKCNKLKNKKYTLNYILNKTKQNIGDKQYFRWTLSNNCQQFTKKILLTMKLFNKKNMEFMEYKNAEFLKKTLKRNDKIYLYIFYFFLNIHYYIYKMIY